MARLPYADPGQPGQHELARLIVEQRGSLLHLYRMLLHSPPLAEAWLAFFTAVRQRLALPGALRELVIMRVAHLNGAPYEAEQHAPYARREGLGEAQLAAVGAWEASGAFTPLQRAALQLADAMTRDVQVPAAVFGAVAEPLGERQTVELVATIAAYNLVSRFLEALQIHGGDAV